ncbi:MAG TPA: glycerol-3-phosphate dehydrogenase/oxidase [Candidatus Dormibacteraeota bacterium]|nr:glycerol-3-phosphate dehydrogenase/oxidase [Candidatus Dormibacteraeota bacterium]
MSGTYDVIVIGGGITGAGVARDLARRGLSVLILEKDDWGGGTSGGSSWMIHGGPRYLEFDWRTTQRSCEDAGKIVTAARHLVHRVVFLLPILPGAKHGLEQMETAMEVYDRYQPLKHSNAHARLSAAQARELEPALAPEVVGAVTMEEWGVDPHRLTWVNVLDAIEHGARALNHSRVEGLLVDGGTVHGVRYRAADGSRAEARARAVVNAAGPWSAQIAAMGRAEVKLRPAKGIHIIYDRRISNFAIESEAIDGRSLLCVPHGAFTLLGTTDDDFQGDPDEAEVSEEEVDYLLQGFARVLPDIRAFRPVRSTVAVRPTLHRWRPYEDDLSRAYRVIDHGENTSGGPVGLISIVGGKLSMYRQMAEETSDAVCRQLGIQSACTTVEPLPGNESEAPTPAAIADRLGISLLSGARALSRHGTRVEAALTGAGTSRVLCRCEALTEAELIYCARNEMVTGLDDAFRRCGLASGPCAGGGCLSRAAQVLGMELGWSQGQRIEAVEDFLRRAWPKRQPVLGPAGWAQEELDYARRQNLVRS